MIDNEIIWIDIFVFNIVMIILFN